MKENNLKYTVDCVIVTYNRLNLLKECLNAVLNQSYQINHVFVVDNNSTDQTWKYLEELSKLNRNIYPIHLDKNLGGAGGFNKGLKAFIERSKSDFVWIMDDDTIPSNNALDKLIQKIPYTNKLGYLCSNVRWKDGNAAIMNIPNTSTNWNEKVNRGLVGITSTSFVSLLVPRLVINEVGYPIAEFFIWGDDVEYTLRIIQHKFNGYLVSDSIVEHKIKNNIGTNIILEKDKKRLKRYYFAQRNTFYNRKKRCSKKDLIKFLISQGLIEPLKILKNAKNYKWYRFKILVKGNVAGMFFNPPIEQVTYKKDNI